MTESDSRRIALSLVSHTNVGKTTLARTLLGRDVGTVRDAPHVTDVAESFVLVETEQGDALELWDTPGFGDSVRLAKRLQHQGSPTGWFLTEVWDRFRDRPFWSTQQAIRNVYEHADLVLYLVNASEDPADAGYVAPEMRVLELLGKPVVVLLNQLGVPKPPQLEKAQIERWRAAVTAVAPVHAVLPLDAFARCWVQELTLLHTLANALPQEHRAGFDRLALAWRARREATFAAALDVLADRLAFAASDREAVGDEGLRGRLRELGRALGLGREGTPTPREAAMARLAARLDENVRVSTDRLIAVHELGGNARSEIITRLAEHYAVRQPLSEGKAALFGGALTGALAGLKADLATGGLTFGGGLLAGGVLGALGAAGLARGYNLVRGAERTEVTWTDEVLIEATSAALLAYLAVAHYGRGRGEWSEAEKPEHWSAAVEQAIAAHRDALLASWGERLRHGAEELRPQLRRVVEAAARDLLDRLYPPAARTPD